MEESQVCSGNDGSSEDGVSRPIDAFQTKHYKDVQEKELNDMTGRNLHFNISQVKCLTPLKEWKANGAARMAFPAYLTVSGRPDTTSTTFAALNVLGATR